MERVRINAREGSEQLRRRLQVLPEDPILRQKLLDEISFYDYRRYRGKFFVTMRWCARVAGWEGTFSLMKAYEIVREAGIVARVFEMKSASEAKSYVRRTYIIFACDFDRAVEVLGERRCS